MAAENFALVQGLRDTKGTLAAWNDNPGPVLKSWFAGALLIAVALLPVVYSYGTYLTKAGEAPVSVRTVDWFRDHGFETVINDASESEGIARFLAALDRARA